MTFKKSLMTLSLACAPVLLLAQGKGLDPADLLKPLGESWVTYSGDYSGKRYSSLTQINQKNVMNLTLAWTSNLTAGSIAPAGGFGGGNRGGGGGAPLVVGGEGTGAFDTGGGVTVKASALQVDGTIYLTAPDNGWAIDARDGRELWHYFW